MLLSWILILAALHPLRKWAHILLERCEALFGKKHCIKMLTKKVEAYTLFSGIECPRMAWKCISAAALHRWGIKTGLRFTFAAACLNHVKCLLRVPCKLRINWNHN